MVLENAVAPAGAARAYLFLVITTLVWGGNAVAGQLAVGQVSPLLLTSLRWLFVCVALLAFARGKVAGDWPRLKPRLASIAAMGVLGYTGFNALFYLAAHYTRGVNIAILQGAIPMFVFIFAYLAHGTRIRGAQLAGMATTLVGIVLVAAKGSFATLAALDFNVGDLIMLFACALYGGYTAALRSRPQVSDLAFFTVMATAAFLTSLPLVALEWAQGKLMMPTPWGWAVTLWIALFPSLLSQLTYMRGVAMIGPGRAGIFANLVPIFGAAMAVAFLGEPFGWYHAAGVALVVGGIVWAQRA
ncbi:DMT family transporter [Prosthecomicrobium sp. N25]|uniref:DMT family transporter n=1 Tax=Prosthecomicrobium sp. N25 TaxID=3129254 RepID=UPI003077575B